MKPFNLQTLSCFLLVLQLANAFRLFPRFSSLYADNDDDFSLNYADWPNDAPAAPVDDGYQTFTRDGATLRVKPQQQTIRIGGTNVPPEQMIRQAELMKGLEPVAVRQLLATKQPVVRTTFENGQKHTSTYTLESDGSITCKTVEDVDPKMVDAEFDKLFQRRKQQQQQQQPPPRSESKSRTQTNWEWTPAQSSAPAPAPMPTQHSQPTAGLAHEPWTPQQPQPARAPTHSYPQLPETWNQHTWPQHDPFSPAELPPMGSSSTDNDDFDDPFFRNPYPQTNEAQPPKKTVTTTTHTDEDGNTVQTTFTMGPNEWKRKTVKISKQHLATPSTTPKVLSLEEFLRSQYDATSTTPRSIYNYDAPRTTTTAYDDKPATTINVNDLPLMAVLNSGQPLDEHYLRSYPTELQPLTGSNQTPIKTIKVEDIPPTPEHVETTKVKTVTKTLHSDVLPTAADLDPNMLAMLQRAGIKPEDILAAKGNAITKTRVEPDGRVVKTTYRVRTMPATENVPTSPNYAPEQFEPSNAPPLFKPWQAPTSLAQAGTQYARPAHFPEHTPTQTATRHYSASRSGVQFPPSTTTTTARPVRDREPLEPAITLNPMHIHPIQQAPRPALPAQPNAAASKPISEFLAKIGLTMDDILLQNGELTKTITDDDGRKLTVRFMLSAPSAPQK